MRTLALVFVALAALLLGAGPGAAAQVVEGTAVLIPAAFVQVSSWVDPATGRRTGQQGD